jgi:hypothetical protein
MQFNTSALALAVVALVSVTACGGATRNGSPRSPAGTAALTGAQMGVRFSRVLVAEKGSIVMVARDGCVAAITSVNEQKGEAEEMRVRCPKPERLKAWFASVDKITASIPVEPVTDDSPDELLLPAAELVTSKGAIVLVKERADAERLLGEVRALSAELASSEMPAPGPTSANGWQLLRVAGPAHVFMGGAPTSGLLDARMSTNGQYLCEFVTTTDDGPIRASKSGWIAPTVASRAIDEVLSPLADVGTADRHNTTFASGIAGGAERRANAASTGAVFQRFALVQDALGDACLPELDPPSNQVGL